MKKLIYLLMVLMFSSCMMLKQVPKREYLSILEIKREYKLTNKQCKEIIKLSIDGEIDVKYHVGRDQWMYTVNYDYTKFSSKTE